MDDLAKRIFRSRYHQSTLCSLNTTLSRIPLVAINRKNHSTRFISVQSNGGRGHGRERDDSRTDRKRSLAVNLPPLVAKDQEPGAGLTSVTSLFYVVNEVGLAKTLTPEMHDVPRVLADELRRLFAGWRGRKFWFLLRNRLILSC